MNIEKEIWHICKICNEKIQNLAKIYGGCGVYYTKVFKLHLKKDHSLLPEEYFEKYTERPICKCGLCGQKTDIQKKNLGDFYWKEYKCGRTEGTMEWSEKAKITRKGSGNPMYGKDSWNKGLTKDNCETLKKMGEKRKGTKASIETRKKLSNAMKRRLESGENPPHTGHHHTEENKEKQRQMTLQMIKDGKFSQIKSKPHIEFSKILNETKIEYEEEKIVHYWTFDFYIPILDLYIEVDGDYFHSNPKFYPNGPKTNTQKINWHRDIKKNKYCLENNLKLLRFWECDILNNPEEIKCDLKELLELKK